MRTFSPHLTAVLVGLLLFGLGHVTARQSVPPTAPTALSTAFTYGSARAGNDEIYMINADGSNPINRTNHAGFEYESAW